MFTDLTFKCCLNISDPLRAPKPSCGLLSLAKCAPYLGGKASYQLSSPVSHTSYTPPGPQPDWFYLPSS